MTQAILSLLTLSKDGRPHVTTPRVLLRLVESDWPLLCLVALVYSQFPDGLRLFNAEPLAVLIVAALAARRILLGQRFPDLRLALALVTLYGLVGATSLVWAADLTRGQAALLRYAKDAALFVIVATAVDRAATLRRATWAVVMAGIVMTAVPIYQRVSGNYATDFWGLGQSEVAHIWGDLDSYRLSGTLSDPNCYAQALVPIVVFGFALVWTEPRRAGRVVAFLAAAAGALGIILSSSRAGALGLALAACVLLLVFRPRRRTALILAGLAVAVAPFLSGPYAKRIKTVAYLAPGRQLEMLEEPGYKGRVSEVVAGLRMFRDHPITGVGLGNYEFHYQRYARALGIDQRKEDREAHSLPVEIASETGLPGLVAFGLILAVTFTNVRRARRSIGASNPTAAALTIASGIAVMMYLTTSLTLHDAYMREFWIVAAIAFATAQAATHEDVDRQ